MMRSQDTRHHLPALFLQLCFAFSVLLLLLYIPHMPINSTEKLHVRENVHIAEVETIVSTGDITLVESLPVGNFSLQSSLPMTHEVLTSHVHNATKSIDISAMYWNLLGDLDRQIYSDDEMHELGADRGTDLWNALYHALQRGVEVRILTAKEKIGENNMGSDLPVEVQKLLSAFPQKLQVHTWSGEEWYGGGILHQKIWIFDTSHVYIGSANNDWKSLAQVMEMGVLFENLAENSPALMDILRLFDLWWMWGTPYKSDGHDVYTPPSAMNTKTKMYYSNAFQSRLQVPSWSLYLPESERTTDPFVKANLSAIGNADNQIPIDLESSRADTNGSSSMFLSAAPLEATAGHSRTFDEDALVYTIHSAEKHLSLSVMDFDPFSQYQLATHRAPIHWPALTDAILAGVYAKRNVRYRLLISHWAHSRPLMWEALIQLQRQADMCLEMFPKCTSTLEIRQMKVPGWDQTTIRSRKDTWPSFSRVNHAKFIVSDQRANIGTSNMLWGYFYTTAGMSVNTNHERTRAHLDEVFERNWNSPFATPLE